MPKQNDYPIAPVPFDQVQVDDAFWSPRLQVNRTVTLPFNFEKCEETGRISNFDKAAGKMAGAHEGIHFNDSDVFKVMEGAAYSLRLHEDPELDAHLDALIEKVASAQEDDGYLYTLRTIHPDVDHKWARARRWAFLIASHELYNVGHMYEAAVAHFQATGKRAFLDVALRNANLIAATFGVDGIRDVPGHQEIELGLVKLFRATGERKFLALAKFFLDERGCENGRVLSQDAAERQDHAPVTEQSEAVGHAVRAGYMYSAMADVAALTGDRAYVESIDRLWTNVVSRKMYVTGGVGSRHHREVFGDDYELPNESAYCETCAAIAQVMWNHRMFLLHGDAKYFDVLERVLYNGFLAGVSLSGKAFFYPNPLASDGAWAFNKGSSERQPWFGCSCCPTNVVRFLPSLPGYVYAVKDDAVYVNLFIGGKATVHVEGRPVIVRQETAYPWQGVVKVGVEVEAPLDFELRIRLPGWSRGEPVPGDLYGYVDEAKAQPAMEVNGTPAAISVTAGFASVRRTWKAGDSLTLHLPMPVRRIGAHERVEPNRGRVAIERGPILFCAEAIDNGPGVRDRVLPDSVTLEAAWRPELLNGLMVLTGGDWRLIPYYAWCHRGANEMAVWIKNEHV
ncbi:MAG: glycoside hydrolase family 127 protein [bacterium]|nr:glycoside hydrolase family 127 protein [bacterium]